MGEPVRAVIDDAGRLALPVSVRDEAGIEPGMTLEISVRGGRVEIEPVPREVKVIQRGPLWVAAPVVPSEVVQDCVVEHVRREIRDRGI